MTQTVTAKFENGVLRPLQPLDLPENVQVRLTVELPTEEERRKRNQEALAALEELWKNIKVHSTEPHLTRDQLHERR